MRFRMFTLIFLVTLMSGCVTTNSEHPNQISSVEDDQFSKAITINGARLYINPFGGTFRSWFIRSWVNKSTGNLSHQLYVVLRYIGSWNFFSWASDDTAKSLNVQKIDSQIGNCMGGCNFEEIVGIDLDDETLRSRVNSGYSIKLSAKSGDAIIINISPEQIRLQIEAVGKYSIKFSDKKRTDRSNAARNYPKSVGVDAQTPAADGHTEIEQMVRSWAVAWASRNVDDYVAFYSDKSFVPEKFPNRGAWKIQREKVIKSAGSIRVTLTDMKITDLDAAHVKVTFMQDYWSNNHQDKSKKTLLLQKEDGVWKITREY